METELKFQIPPERREPLRAWLAEAGLQTTRLAAIYFDTADCRLARAGLALRLRQEDERWVQTLKGRGDGMLERLEHEVKLPPRKAEPKLDIARHAGTEVGALLHQALAGSGSHGDEALQPLFRTEVLRLYGEIDYLDTTVEIALDSGRLVAGTGEAQVQAEVEELELELLKGRPALLIEVGVDLVRRFDLWWDNRTKAERGFALALKLPPPPPAVMPAGRLRIMARPAAPIQYLQRSLLQAQANGVSLADGRAEPGHLHHLRLAIDRIRRELLGHDWTDLDPFNAELPPGPHAGRLSAEWKKQQAALGAVRGDLAAAGAIVRSPGYNRTLLRTLERTLDPWIGMP